MLLHPAKLANATGLPRHRRTPAVGRKGAQRILPWCACRSNGVVCGWIVGNEKLERCAECSRVIAAQRLVIGWLFPVVGNPDLEGDGCRELCGSRSRGVRGSRGPQVCECNGRGAPICFPGESDRRGWTSAPGRSG